MKITTIKFYFALLLFITTKSFSQESNNWYFGLLNGLRLDFATSPPTVSNGFPLVTEEGSAAISDLSGNPLFYTDGVTVWDASTNSPFATGLLGGTSSTQSAIIIPKPGSTNEWLLFTSNTDPNNGASNGINYYTVSGMLGSFSISLATSLAINNEVGEGLCIMGSSKPGESFWVISHERSAGGSKNIRAYSVSNLGVVNPTPQISSIGAGVAFSGYIGSVKANTCQNRLAFTYYSNSTKVEIYDFNASTGNVTALTSSITIPNAYGIEFSPNDNYLYVSQLNEGTLHQFNIATNTDYTEPAWDRAGEIGQLQLAPDNKIYVALHGGGSGNEYLGVVNSPNLPGNSASYIMNGLLVTTQPNPNGFVFRGLPTFSKTSVAGILQAFPGDGEYCVNTSIDFSFNYTGNVTSIDWDWGDGTAHGSTNAMSHTYTSIGTKNVILAITDGCGKVVNQSFTLTIQNPKTPSGIIGCYADHVTFTANGIDILDYPNYAWYNGTNPGAVLLGVGSPVNYQVGTNGSYPSQICVEVTAAATTSSSGTNESIASSNLLGSAANATPYTSPLINVLADVLVLKSFDVKIYPACTNATFTVTIQDGLGNTVFTDNYTTGGVCTNYTVNVNTSLPKGNGYKIILSASPFVLLHRGDWRGATNAGAITYVADPWANSTSIANLVYDYKNFSTVNTCTNTSCYTIDCTVLPVEFYNYNAQYKDEKVILNWSVNTEAENSYFEVERSTDGHFFIPIGSITFNSVTNEYSFVDISPEYPVNYYRIVGYDASRTIQSKSSIQIIHTNEEKNMISIYPNPSADQFTIQTNEEIDDLVISVLDIFGRELYNEPQTSKHSLSSIGKEWPKGYYILQYSTKDFNKYIPLLKE